VARRQDEPDELQRLIDNKPTDDVELIEATVFDQKRGDYCYHVIYKEGKQELVYRRRMKLALGVISRYMKVAGEIYGRGPLITALPDIKTLNKTQRAAAKECEPGDCRRVHSRRRWRAQPNTVKRCLVPSSRWPGTVDHRAQLLRPCPAPVTSTCLSW
jgi:hypothetical protein